MRIGTTPRTPVEMGLHTWPIVHAVAIGVSGLAGFVVAIIAVTILNRTLYLLPHLSTYEAQALDIIFECAAAICAGYIATIATGMRSFRRFFSSIQWCARYGAIASFITLGLCLSLVMRYVVTRHFALRIDGGGGILIALILLGTVVLQPFIEETYFRGVLFASLAQRLGPLISIIVVTVLFVFFHPQHYGLVLPIGIVIGAVRICTQSTANCFALHAGYNLGVVLWGIR
jgi:membrane protease YdiL (CAAX protease family)